MNNQRPDVPDIAGDHGILQSVDNPERLFFGTGPEGKNPSAVSIQFF